MPPLPSLTRTWHSQSYPAIDPIRPELSANGRTIAITGAGGSVGAATALAFAKAGAARLRSLVDVRNRFNPLNQKSKQQFQGLRHIDILICPAGYLSHFQKLEEAEPEEWFKDFEINAKGAFNCSQAFASAAAAQSILVDITTCVVHMPAMASASSYMSSKLAGTKIYETFGMENPSVQVVHIHPGVVYSELNVKSGITALDDADLPANFILWVCSPKAKAFRGNGKYLWCHWDVEELKNREDELGKPDQLTITMNGWPFGGGEGEGKDALKF